MSIHAKRDIPQHISVHERKNYERVEVPQIPISRLPVEILEKVFALLPTLTDFKAVLRVSGFWNQVADGSLHWQRFKQHYQQLAQLFSHLSPNERKRELDKGNRLLQVVQRGDQCRQMFLRVPVLCFRESIPKLFSAAQDCPKYARADDRPQLLDLKERYMLCQQSKCELNLLDLAMNKITAFGLHDILNDAEEALKSNFSEALLNDRLQSLIWIDDRYLVTWACEVTTVYEDQRIFILDTKDRSFSIINPWQHFSAMRGRGQIAVLFPFRVWRPPSGPQIMLGGVHTVEEDEHGVVFHRFQRYELATRRMEYVGEFIEFALDDVETNRLAPEYLVHDQLFAINAVSQATQETPLTVFDNNHVRSQIGGTDCYKEKILGGREGSLYTLGNGFRTANDTMQTVTYLYHHYLVMDGKWQSERLVLNEEIKSALEQDVKQFSISFFYPHILVYVFNAAYNVPKSKLRIWNLRNQKSLFALDAKDGFYIGNHTLVGDQFIFAGAYRSTSIAKLFACSLGSQKPPEEIPIFLQSRAHKIQFYLYGEKLVVKDKRIVTIWDFALPQAAP